MQRQLPSSCRAMLGEHTSIARACHCRQQEQRVLHERGTSATSFAIVRLHVTSGYPYASVVCMGPGYGPLSVYGRCVVLILLPRVSTFERVASSSCTLQSAGDAWYSCRQQRGGLCIAAHHPEFYHPPHPPLLSSCMPRPRQTCGS